MNTLPEFFTMLFLGGMLSSPGAPGTLPSIDGLWDQDRPAQTEQKLAELLPEAKKAGETSYELQLLTQIGRAQAFQGKFEQAHATLDRVKVRLTDEDPLLTIRYNLERGRAYDRAHQPDLALPHYLKAFEQAQASQLEPYATDASHLAAITTFSLAHRELSGNKRLAVTEQ